MGNFLFGLAVGFVVGGLAMLFALALGKSAKDSSEVENEE